MYEYITFVSTTSVTASMSHGAHIWRFDPRGERFERFPLPDRGAGVRQIAGRKGEVWAAESGADKLVVLSEE